MHGGLGVWRATIDRAAPEARLDLIERAAAVQRETRALHAFAPLARHDPRDTPSTGYDDVKTIAVARLVCASIPSIQVDWPLYGPKLAQVAIAYGADDIDGVRRRRHARPRASPLARRGRRAADRARHSRRRSSATAGSSRAREPSRPPRGGELSQRPAARVRSRSHAGSRHAPVRSCRRSARSCSRAARSISAWCRRSRISIARAIAIVPGVCIGSDGPCVGRALHARAAVATSARSRSTRRRARRRSLTRVLCARRFDDLADVHAARAGSRRDARRRGRGAAHRRPGALRRRSRARRREDRPRRGVDRDDRAAVRLGVLGRAGRAPPAPRSSRLLQTTADEGMRHADAIADAYCAPRRRRISSSPAGTCATICGFGWTIARSPACIASIGGRGARTRRRPRRAVSFFPEPASLQ